MKRHILNIDILFVSEEDLLKQMDKGVLYTPNVDHLVKLQHDREFYDAYRRADWVICDSRIILYTSKILKQPIKETIPGSSFFCDFYNHHKNNPNCRIFLLGSAEGVARKAMHRINKKLGTQIVIGTHSPSFGFEKDEVECSEIIDRINASGATVLVVGVGAPKQEKWIAKYKTRMSGVKLFMALGATIDFEAGMKKRAPLIWQKMSLEWLYRFLCEPKRLFRRYFIDDMKFFWYIGKQMLGIYHNPWSPL
ncbi:WecB/TagA/CpsF family glycosyltransferase [Bacteroides sp. AN502(2024)]|uniref:WecB/TagA/CpsF family glycosyltransferase n=1 Tax=Bacteroides sp. AN502(2024) TaxID=3160599 RepID=UPI003517C159